jgi:ABC-type branched-subunit amino acid transport system substrate-binding protein
VTQSIGALSRRRFGAALAASLGFAGALAGCGGTVAGPGPRPQAGAPPGLGSGSSPVVVGPPPAELGQAQSGAPNVALLLPLSGPNAALGRALQDAAQMAVFDNADRTFRLIPRDTGGTPDGAARAAQEAIAQGARLIVGPLLATEAQAVGPIAAGAGVNIITLSNDRSVAGANVFVIGLTPNQQMSRLIAFARSRGVSRFAALLPNNAFGSAVEESVRANAAAAGGELVRVARYDASGDPSSAIQTLIGQPNSQQGAQPPRGGPAPRPQQVDFDALVMPDQAGRLLTIAPLVQFYGVDPARVRILGSAFMGWDVRVQREPALVGAWYAAPPPEARADFDRRYRETYSRDAPPLATLAYDATAVAAVLAKTRNGDFSTAAIGSPQGFAGMDGVFRFRPDGTAERALAVIEVQRDGLRAVSPAAQQFDAVTQ